MPRAPWIYTLIACSIPALLHLTSEKRLGAQEPIRVVERESPTEASLRGVCSVSRDVVWISGAQGTVLRSLDGGESFEDIAPPDSDAFDFRDIHAFDANRCSLMVAGQPPRFYHTLDGGKNWQIAYEHPDENAFFDAMDFWDDQHGIAFGDPIDGRLVIVTTDDGGKSWKLSGRESSPEVTSTEHGYAASGTCLRTSGSRDVWIGLGGHDTDSNSNRSRILRSTDRGQSWEFTSSTLDGSSSAGVFSLTIAGDGRAIAVGGDYQQPDDDASVLSVSSDAGATWLTPSSHGLRGYRSCVAKFVNNNRAAYVACGPSGCDYSLDSGETWQPLTDIGYHAIDFDSEKQTGWAVGAGGKIACFEVPRQP